MIKQFLILINTICVAIFCLGVNPAVYGQNIGLVDVRYAEQVITVGGPDADIPDFSSTAVQIALDAIRARGGGTVKLAPGIFNITGPLRLSSNTSLVGSGQETILKKQDGFRTGVKIDIDYGMLKATVNDVSGLGKGMGIQISDDKYKTNWEVTTAIITDIQGDVIYFDNNAVNNYLSSQNAVVTNGYSIIETVSVENVRIANLRIEGNKDNNDYINGCRGGGVYIYKSKNCIVEDVKINGFNGDTFSWQITENVTVRRCEASNGNEYGFHPGAGTDHSIVVDCVSHNNKKHGIFICWRVQNGVFRNNIIFENGSTGISIGHQDTDNLFEGNHIYQNGKHGVYFRNENEQNSAHRNVFINNIIENNGVNGESAGFYIGGETRDIKIENNTIRSTGKGNQSTAIIVGKNSSGITISGNKVSGSKEVIYEL